MHPDKMSRKILQIIFILTLIFSNAKYLNTVYAGELSFYNYNTKSTVNYTGKQVTYFYNTKEVSLSYPGILISGTALADVEELFADEIGITTLIEDNVITLTDGTTKLILTLGSKNVKLNGTTEKISVAPVKLKFDDTIKYYVPTRYVAEAFGLNYVWHSETSSVSLTKTLILSINSKTILYSGAFYDIAFGENAISFDMPVLSLDGQIMAPAKAVFEALGCEYEENFTNISVTKGDISLNMELNSDAAYINDVCFEMDAAPVSITNQRTNTQQVYIPLEYVVHLLGYDVSYRELQHRYSIQETDYTGILLSHPELKDIFRPTDEKIEEQKPLKYYFEWSNEKSDVAVSGKKTISKVVGYALENADVIEIYGVTRDDINDFLDNRALIFELKSVLSNMGTQFFSDFEIPHLNYVLMTTVNNSTKFFLMVPLEDEWHFVEKEDCVQIYFMNADLSKEDLLLTSESKTETKATTENSEIIYPENELVILLPEELDYTKISVYDNYLENNFQIAIPGNFVEFFENNSLINPYECIQDIVVSYDKNQNITMITCHTTYICGFKYTFESDYMAFTVGKPNEIYNKIVVLDAGHGGKDPGATYNNVLEKNVNFNILSKTKTLFENSDIKVYYTRESDVFVSLENRTKFVKEVCADIFISLHMNASTYTTAKGTEIFYSKSNNTAITSGLTSYKLAKAFSSNLCAAMDSSYRGIASADYYVITYNSVPAILIELGFISNSEECSKLTNDIYQYRTANAIYQSVIDVFCAYPTGR